MDLALAARGWPLDDRAGASLRHTGVDRREPRYNCDARNFDAGNGDAGNDTAATAATAPPYRKPLACGVKIASRRRLTWRRPAWRHLIDIALLRVAGLVCALRMLLDVRPIEQHILEDSLAVHLGLIAEMR